LKPAKMSEDNIYDEIEIEVRYTTASKHGKASFR
jgi:hypothetical protein